jgi:hypothetical protein
VGQGREKRGATRREGREESNVHDKFRDTVVSSHLRDTTGDNGGTETGEEAKRRRKNGLNPEREKNEVSARERKR